MLCLYMVNNNIAQNHLYYNTNRWHIVPKYFVEMIKKSVNTEYLRLHVHEMRLRVININVRERGVGQHQN